MNKTPVAKAITLLPQQQAVVDWVIKDNGSLELVARAGCGKTFTLIEVVKTIVQLGLGDVALMAFNKTIAEELKAKLARHGFDWKQAEANTVHSFGFRAWRKAAPGVQLNEDKVRSILEVAFESSGNPIYKHCRGLITKFVGLAKQTGFGIPRAGYPDVDNVDAWYAVWEHHDLQEEIADITDEQGYPVQVTFEEIVDLSIRIYKRSLQLCREVVDFNDMILAPLVFRARFFKKKWILVDESQDTNATRRALALEMLAPGGRMIFVGDDRQAIYGFTGADSNAMRLLKEATKAKSLPLNVTMRCPKTVVQLAKSFVPDFTAHEEAPEGIVRQLGQYEELLTQNLSPDDAILCRNTAPLLKTAFFLLGKGIACQVEGRDIGEALVKLANRWKAKDLDQYLTKLADFQEKQTEKLLAQKKEAMVDRLVDQLDCLRIIVADCMSKNKHSVKDLVAEIQEMFGERDARKPTLMLSTIHKAKGREWKRVFALGRNEFLPSPWAKQEWQQVQEANLEYVLITRAMTEFIDVPAPPKEDKKGGTK